MHDIFVVSIGSCNGYVATTVYEFIANTLLCASCHPLSWLYVRMCTDVDDWMLIMSTILYTNASSLLTSSLVFMRNYKL